MSNALALAVVSPASTLETIYAAASSRTASSGLPVEEPGWIDALMRMTPSPDLVRHGDQWLQQHCERLDGGRFLMANVSRDATGVLRVAAHTDPTDAGVEWRRLREDILGRPSGVTIHRTNALDLVGRVAVNEHDVAFRIRGLEVDAASGRIVINLVELDEEGEPIPDSEFGIFTLDGWSVC